MLKKQIKILALATALVSGANLYAESDAPAEREDGGGFGGVFAATNDSDHNSIVEYLRAPDGRLRYISTVPTSGRGSGGTVDPLQSQGSLAMSKNRSSLFAINAGSRTISSFLVSPLGLVPVSQTNSAGAEPISLAVHDNLLYVLNTASF
jgi:6-phosphogluconolactonase